jgi:orotidine-5'-phosphate decarboxylase
MKAVLVLMTKTPSSRIIVALDCDNFLQFESLLAQLNPLHCRVKIGKELFTLFGPSVVERAQNLGFEVFLDLKFHDIPNTVAKAVKAAANLGVWMVNVHASGGGRMLDAAVEALVPYQQKPLLIAVTVLTSMTEPELHALGVSRSLAEHVRYLAGLAAESGLDGVVCSAQEAATLKMAFGPQFRLVTPGIRPSGCDIGDQRRVLSPEEAIRAGSDYLVIGRPITGAQNPAFECERIIATIASI